MVRAYITIPKLRKLIRFVFCHNDMFSHNTSGQRPCPADDGIVKHWCWQTKSHSSPSQKHTSTHTHKHKRTPQLSVAIVVQRSANNSSLPPPQTFTSQKSAARGRRNFPNINTHTHTLTHSQREWSHQHLCRLSSRDSSHQKVFFQCFNFLCRKDDWKSDNLVPQLWGNSSTKFPVTQVLLLSSVEGTVSTNNVAFC